MSTTLYLHAAPSSVGLTGTGAGAGPGLGPTTYSEENSIIRYSQIPRRGIYVYRKNRVP